MLKIMFNIGDISVSHDSLNFTVAAKEGLECSIGFANAKEEHRMVDFVVEKIQEKEDINQLDVRFLIKDPQTQPLKTIKDFTVHMKDEDVYEFTELE